MYVGEETDFKSLLASDGSDEREALPDRDNALAQFGIAYLVRLKTLICLSRCSTVNMGNCSRIPDMF